MPSDAVPERVSASGWSSPVEVRQLRAFLAVVEHGSVSAAALALGLAQSTVSEALASLDRAAGTPTLLRRRGAHAIALTDAGTALLPHARRVLQEIDAMHLAVARVARGAHASVHVVANESVSTYLLAPAIAALRRRWPNVRFSVAVGTCASVRAAVAAGQCDLGLLLEANAEAGPSAAVLAPGIPLVVFAGETHPLLGRPASARAAVARGALAPYPLYVADSAGDFHDLVQRYFAADGLRGPQLQPVGSIEGVKRGVSADASALGLLPHYAVAEDLAAGRVHGLTLLPAPPRMGLVALRPASPAAAGAHPVIADLLEALRGAGAG